MNELPVTGSSCLTFMQYPSCPFQKISGYWRASYEQWVSLMNWRLLFLLRITICRVAVLSPTMIPATSLTTGALNLRICSLAGVLSGLMTIAWLLLSSLCICDLKNFNNLLCSSLLTCAWQKVNWGYCSRNVHPRDWRVRVRSPRHP